MLIDYITRHQNILFAIVLVFVALIGFLSFDALSKQGLHAVPIRSVPNDAAIEVDGVSVGQGTAHLPEGTHVIKASKEGYASKTTTLVVDKETDYSQYEPLLLVAESEDAKKWATENREAYGDFPDLQSNLDPVFAYIPYTDMLYSVSSDSTSQPIRIRANSLGIYKNAPIDYLKRSGIDPSDYTFTFNYVNPFEAGANE